jgi:hypothetical protein
MQSSDEIWLLNDSKLDLYFSTNNAIHYLGEALEGGVCM